jgi:MFS family permease
MYLGDQMLAICVTVRVFKAFGTGAALGTYYVIRQLPPALVSPVAGVFIDRLDRRRLAAGGLVLSSAAAVGLYYSNSMSLVLAFVFLGALGAVVYGPSLKGMLPEVVEKEHLLQANSVQSGTESVARLAAPVVSAAVLSIAGTSGALLGSACSYLLAAGTVFHVSVAGMQAAGSGGASGLTDGVRDAWKELLEGVRYLATERALLPVTAAVTLVMFADTSVSPLFTILLNKHLKVPPEFIGFLSSGYGAGLLIGAVLGPFLAKATGESGLVPLGAGLIGIQMLAYSRIQAFWLTLPLQLMCGTGFALLLNGATTSFQIIAPRRLIGRAFSASAALGSAATIIAARAGGAVADSLGVRAVFLGAGLVSLCAAACSLRLARGARAGSAGTRTSLGSARKRRVGLRS